MSEVTPVVPAEPEKPKFPVLSDRTYNFLKWLVLIALPAASAFFVTVAALWDLNPDFVTKVVGTLTGLATLLGILIGISTASFNRMDPKYAGDLVVRNSEEGSPQLFLALDKHPDHLLGKDKIVLKVNNQS